MTLTEVVADEVASIGVFRLRLPLLEPFRASHGVESTRELILVKWERGDGYVGWGECPTLTRPTYTAEYTEGAFHLLTSWVVPSLVAGQVELPRGWPMLSSALRTAALDARLRSEDLSLRSYLGATTESVPAGAVLGEVADLDELVRRAEEQVAAGAALLKLKIRPGYDTQPLRAIRIAWPEIAVAADANGSYRTPDDLAGLQDLDLTYLEQPLPVNDLLGHQELCRRGVTVALDESIVDRDAALLSVRLGAAQVFSIKPARVGGVESSREIRDVAVDAGIGLFCGGMLETAVGRATALAVAAMPGFGYPTDLGPSGRYFTRDVAAPVVRDPNGSIPVPGGPGIGVEPEPERLVELTVDERSFTP
ncbi:MAG: o-succinylbenzoate synthase [Acidimicrobiales bacterium]|nr:MAG: o-succinylbenzoate synthase [Actinomycetota bacterium]MBV6508762.1 o-succinylbenzoate synthase [Acidimicrobiales bacterium]RIK06502.1 MAG: o-succinylbenzoate synthase [Acidobacteriota bacterium]